MRPTLAEIEIDRGAIHVRVNGHMNAITYTTARENLARTIEKVVSDRDPVIITKKNDMSVVMMSLDDYESLQETAHLLRSPTNARRLLESISELEKGKGIERETIE